MMTKQAVADHFKLPRTTVRDIISKQFEIVNFERNSKHMKKGFYPDLENALFIWFNQKRSQNFVINDDILKTKAKEFGENMSKFKLFLLIMFRIASRFSIQ